MAGGWGGTKTVPENQRLFPIKNWLNIKELKEEEKPVKSLNHIQIKNLLIAAAPYSSIKI